MYTIKQAAIRSGVAVSLIRAWERRYRVVQPDRTEAGYRLYDEDSIARLRAMRGLIEAGWSAAQAARAVVASPSAAFDADAATTTAPAETGRGVLVDAAARYDLAAIEQALDAMFGRGSFEAVIDDVVLPAAAALGEAWASGRIDVAAEHLASATLGRRLATLFELGGTPGSGSLVLVGLPPGSRHELGVSAFAVALRRRGIDVLYLGADVPVSSWADAALESRAIAAVIGVVMEADASAADRVVAALFAARPGIVVAVGGSGAGSLRTDAAVVQLPDRVTDAAAALAARITNRSLDVRRTDGS